MLMHTSAAAESTGQGKALTSRCNGGRTFDSASIESQARIDLRQSASRSLGCQISFGIARAHCTTCCPVPLPTSRTTPRSGNTCESTSLIGPLFRSADGLNSRSLDNTPSSSHRTTASPSTPQSQNMVVADWLISRQRARRQSAARSRTSGRDRRSAWSNARMAPSHSLAAPVKDARQAPPQRAPALRMIASRQETLRDCLVQKFIEGCGTRRRKNQ